MPRWSLRPCRQRWKHPRPRRHWQPERIPPVWSGRARELGLCGGKGSWPEFWAEGARQRLPEGSAMAEPAATVAETRANFSKIAACAERTGRPATVLRSSKPRRAKAASKDVGASLGAPRGRTALSSGGNGLPQWRQNSHTACMLSGLSFSSAWAPPSPSPPRP